MIDFFRRRGRSEMRGGRTSRRNALSAIFAIGSSFLMTTLARPDAAFANESARSDALLGDWRPSDRDVTVRIERTGSVYSGTVVASSDADHIGRVILRGFNFDASQRTYRGEVFAARRGTFVTAVIRIEGETLFRLTAGTGLFSREIVWRRR